MIYSNAFDRIFHSFLIKAYFQNKNTLSERLKELTTEAALL